MQAKYAKSHTAYTCSRSKESEGLLLEIWVLWSCKLVAKTKYIEVGKREKFDSGLKKVQIGYY